jgi:putative FmdB family regulatory protein
VAVYVYECKTCGNQYEVTQSIKDDKLEEYKCESCNSTQPCRRIIVSANFQLKGDGWYKDGYMTSKDKLDAMGDLM